MIANEADPCHHQTDHHADNSHGSQNSTCSNQNGRHPSVRGVDGEPDAREEEEEGNQPQSQAEEILIPVPVGRW
jgi:hypothetical protein